MIHYYLHIDPENWGYIVDYIVVEVDSFEIVEVGNFVVDSFEVGNFVMDNFDEDNFVMDNFVENNFVMDNFDEDNRVVDSFEVEDFLIYEV